MDPEQAILDLVTENGLAKSVCPTQVARQIDPENWRTQLHNVREAGKRLSDAGQIYVLRKGKVVDPHTAKGVIRYRLRFQK